MAWKEDLTDIIRAQGYDFFTACKLAEDTILDFRNSGKGRKTYHIGSVSVDLEDKQLQN